MKERILLCQDQVAVVEAADSAEDHEVADSVVATDPADLAEVIDQADSAVADRVVFTDHIVLFSLRPSSVLEGPFMAMDTEVVVSAVHSV